ncbi:MAG: hypothetical protein JF603_02805 [Acidobacteria bacterium]|nr:hypothetical protein [Acidobacteriota bacterium]
MALSGFELDGLRLGLAGSAFVFGLRHGIDWDHIAAITDVTSAQETPRRGMRVAAAYAAGHGVVVFGLGVAAILGGDLLPAWLDAAMGRAVGVTLIALSIYVVCGLLRDRRDFRLRSRWMLVAAGVRRARPSLERAGRRSVALDHGHDHRAVAVAPADPVAATTTRAAAVLGTIHGVGAETPTQVVVFLAAAHVAGRGAAVALLLLFIAGIFISNGAVAAVSSFGYLNANRSFRVYAGVSLVNAAFSLVVGAIFLAGGTLPTIIGG